MRVIADPTGAVNGLAVLDQECAPGVGAPSHTHEFEEILTIVEGSAEVWIGDQRKVVGPSTSVFIPTGAIHGFRNVGDTTLRLVGTIAATELRAKFLEH